MATLQIDEGYGLASVRVGQGEPVVLDLWEANNTYVNLQTQYGANTVELSIRWLEFLAGKGLANLSHGAGFAVVDHVIAAIGECQKKGTCSAKPG